MTFDDLLLFVHRYHESTGEKLLIIGHPIYFHFGSWVSVTEAMTGSEPMPYDTVLVKDSAWNAASVEWGELKLRPLER